MKRFYVYGEYGPIGGQFIDRIIISQNEQNARVLFELYVKRWYGNTWARIGQRNVQVMQTPPYSSK